MSRAPDPKLTTATPVIYARRYAAFGWGVFPCQPDAKVPILAGGYTIAASDDASVTAFWRQFPRANVALATGPNFWVLDVDTRHGGDEALAALEARHGPLPDTLRAATPSGGTHYYFAPDPRARNTAGTLGPGLDTRGHGGYVLAEGASVGGSRYSFLDWDPLTSEAPELAVAPDWLIEAAFGEKKSGDRDRCPGGGHLGEGRLGEGQRNDALSRVAFKLRKAGLDVAAIEAALLVENTRRCEPPLPEDEVRAIARGKAAVEPEPGAEWPEALDLRELARRAPTPPVHIIENWLPAGEVTLLAGHGGAGKSLLALQTAVCVALGLAWHGRPTAPRPVFYVSAEDPAAVLHWRMERICARLGVPLAALAGRLEVIDATDLDCELVIETRDGPATTARYDALRVRVRPGAVVVLDGASDLFGASEIVRRDVRYFVRAVRRLVRGGGAALIVAHVDKAAARSGGVEAYSGSTAWHNSVRARWGLRPEGAGVALELAKANHSVVGEVIRLRWVDHLLVADEAGGVAGALRDRAEREGILAALRNSPDPVPAAASGQRTAYHVLSARPGFPAALAADSAGRRRFWGHLENLRACGLVRESSIRAAHRHWVRVLEPVSEGTRECANE